MGWFSAGSSAASSNTAGAAIAGGSGLIGGIISAFTQGRQNRLQRQWQQDENLRAFERNKEMWDLQNVYNSPAEQMKRFKAAGLNPNLIYGKGTPGNASSAPSYEAAKGMFGYDFPNIGNAIQQYQDFMVKNIQMDNMNEINKQIKAKTTAVQLGNIIANWKIAIQPYKFAHDRTAYRQKTKIYEAQINKLIADTNLANSKNWWANQKNTRMFNEGINIDNMDVIDRTLNKVITFGSNYFQGFIDNMTNSIFGEQSNWNKRR